MQDYRSLVCHRLARGEDRIKTTQPAVEVNPCRRRNSPTRCHHNSNIGVKNETWLESTWPETSEVKPLLDVWSVRGSYSISFISTRIETTHHWDCHYFHLLPPRCNPYSFYLRQLFPFPTLSGFGRLDDVFHLFIVFRRQTASSC